MFHCRIIFFFKLLKTQLVHRPSPKKYIYLVHKPMQCAQTFNKEKLEHRPPPPTPQNSTSEGKTATKTPSIIQKTATNQQTTIGHSNDNHHQPKIQIGKTKKKKKEIGKTSQKTTTINQEKPPRTQIKNPRNKEHILKI